MRKIVLVFIFLFSFSIVNASVVTYDRTEEDLRVHSSINVTDSNKQYILNTPSVDESVKVYDFASLLSDTEEENLQVEINNFIEDYNMDVVIVTTNDNPRDGSEEFADDFYDYNYFGIGNSFDGLLFLIDMENREIAISTTGEAQIIYDVFRIDDILDYSYNYIASEDYYNTCLAFIERSADYAESGVPDGSENLYINENGAVAERRDIPFLWCLLGSFVITLVTMLILSSRNKLVKKKANVRNNLVNETSNVEKISQSLINTFTNRVKIVTNSSSSGSFGGGSSGRIGSSGRSHGGGSRKF